MAGFAVTYFAAAEIGRVVAITPGDFATMWPASGLYLAALLVTPVAAWPRVLAAAAVAGLASDVLHGQSIVVSIGLWGGDTLEAAVGAWVLRRMFPAPFTLGRLKNTIAFVCVCALISALGGVISGVLTARTAIGAPLPVRWWTWWTADLIGMMVFTPLVLAFRGVSAPRVKQLSPWRIVEAALYVAGTVAVAIAVFGFLLPHRPVKFLLYPFFLWGVLRFGVGGGSSGLALVSVIAAFMSFGRAPFAPPALPLLDDVHLNQLFLVISALSFLSLAAAIHERDDSTRTFGELVEAMPTFAWTARPDGALDFVSRYARDYTGLSTKAASGAGWQAVVHTDDLRWHVRGWRASVSTGEPLEIEARFRRAADGEYRWFLTRAVPLRDERGAIVKWYGISTDIDDRKRAESLLAGEKRVLEMVARGDSLARILDRLCRLVEEQAPDALASILLFDGDRLRHGAAPSLPKAYTDAIDGAVIAASAGSCGTAAYHGRQVIVEDIVTDPLWTAYRDLALPHSLRACWSTPVFSSEGKVIATFAMYYREPRRPSAGVQAVIEQITHLAGVAIQRRLDEEKLRGSAELLSLAHDAVIVRDLDSRITFWNPGAEKTYGWTAKEAVGRFSHELLQTGFPVSREATNAALVDRGEWEGELTHVTREGTTIVVASRQSLRRDAHGARAAILEINRDVTERRQAEYLIQQVFDNAPDRIVILGRDYRYRRVNPEFAQLVGLPPEKIVGMTVAEVWDDEAYFAQVKPRLDRCFAGEHVAYEEWFETRIGRFYISQTYSPLRLGTDRVEAALIIARPLTEHMLAVESLQKAQAELAHVARVTTLGELAASIAHEVNQPLAAIAADAYASRNWLDAERPDLERVREALDGVIEDAHRAGSVIQRIRQLATKGAPDKAPLDLNDVVRDVLVLVRGEVRHHQASLTLDLAPVLPPVLGDRIQLQQVILNLVVNAIEAMAAVEDRPRELVIRSEAHDGDYVRVAVQDAGPGIDASTANQLFSAFFTTKPGGMGMGLSICRSIVEAHGGAMWATPNAPYGAMFHFSLPVDRGGD